jgi:DNA repair exonuclease SbcCD ATPase subunit
MIVKKIYLENWALFRDPIEVEFSEKLNILYGPNDIGKSTLIDSLRTVFFTKHTSQSEKIRSLVPWGSDLPPRARITFSKRGIDYRITKRFISNRTSVLERLVEKKWQRIAEGDSADKKVIELIGGRLPTRGETKPEFWGIGQALWMVQGEPFISEDLNEETLSSLQKLIGAAIETEKEKAILRKVNERFSIIFTGVRREFKKGSEIRSVEERIEELEKIRAQVEETIREKEELLRKIEDKEILLREKERKLQRLLEEKEELEKKVEEAHEHRRIRERLEEEVKMLRLEYESLKNRLERIKEGQDKIEELNSNVQRLNEKRAKRQRTLAELSETEKRQRSGSKN